MKRKKHNVPTVDNIIGNFAGRPVRVIIVVVSLIAIIFPLYWLLTSSVKIEAEYLSNPPVIFPSKFTAASYQEIFGKDELWLNFFNTVVVAGASTIISVIFGSMAAYAVASEHANILDCGLWFRRCIRQLPLQFQYTL